ncbi:MAG: M15 family metallopeptidase [Cyanobacteria bacterium J06554_6]
MDDIPEARRDSPRAAVQTAVPSRWLWLGSGLLGLMVVGALWYLIRPVATATEVKTEPALASVTEAAATPLVPAAETESGQVSPEAAAKQASLLGHRQYSEVETTALVPLKNNAGVRLHADAAEKVEEMLATARAQGIQLGVISGFRTWEEQRRLFFEVKAERGQNTETRAEVSAPPGYSEHHTGYAVDFVDLSAPETHLEEPFEQTAAFRWLSENANRYGFEMSFPKDNPDISYEPWHWRYVGDPASLEVFFQEQE